MILLSNYLLTHRDCLRLNLTDSYSTHRVVYDLFRKDRAAAGRILFADKGFRHGQRQLLILSGAMPEIGEYGKIEVKSVPGRFLDYDIYHFETIVNPARRRNATGRLEPLRGREEILEWFRAKAPQWGFSAVSLQVEQNWADIFRKGDQPPLTLSRARVRGVLEVTDRDIFKKSFRDGLGRGKAFGCGLLQLQPAG